MGQTSFEAIAADRRTHDAKAEPGRCIQFIGGSWWSSIRGKGMDAAFGGLGPGFSRGPWQRPDAANRTFLV